MSAWSRCRRRTSSTSATATNSPTGSRPPEELRERVAAVAGYLLDRGAKLLVVACNSATAAGADTVRELAAGHGVDVVTVIEPEAEIAAAITEQRPGRRARDARHGRRRRLPPRARRGRAAALEVTEVAAPDLAPIIQHGFTFSDEVVDTVRSYCAPLKPRRRRHPDPRLHPLPAGGADAAADPRTRRPPGHRGPRRRRRRSALARARAASPAPARARAITASSAPETWPRSPSWAPASCRCRSSDGSSTSSWGGIAGGGRQRPRGYSSGDGRDDPGTGSGPTSAPR